MRGILIGHDEEVANWAWQEFSLFPMPFARAVGIVDDGMLIGAAIFTEYSGSDVHLNYYGKNTATVGIARSLALIAVADFDVARGTLLISKRSKRLIRAMLKFGFKIEGVQRRFYGARDCTKNTAVRLVIFREQLEKLAFRKSERQAEAC